MKVIILAGGGGTRLFPLSRTSLPKQFLKIDGKKSLLAQTVRRFLPIASPADIIIVTNQNYYHHVKFELASVGAIGAHIILEPAGRNTAPAIALAVKFCLDQLGSSLNEVLFVTPSDHIVKADEKFAEAVRKGCEAAANNWIITFGIKPDKPETGYGYIHIGEKHGNGYIVKSFHEKPDKATVEHYIETGNYYWNSGMFTFSIGCIKQEITKYQPDIARIMAQPYKEVIANFEKMPNISIDYAVAEKSEKVVVVPLTAYWNDIGSWDAIYDVLTKDETGNALNGDCVQIGCTNSLMLGRSRLIAGIGLEDLLVVETDDVILVAKKGESQKVKDLVEELKKRGRKEATEHTTMYRPWGSYTILGEGPGYKMKKIVVNPGQRLSLQMHYHRSEHWIVTAGTAKVTVGASEQMVHENESIFVPQTTKHRLENPGKIPLEIIEVQNGSYLGEDDIVRYDDVYGRA